MSSTFNGMSSTFNGTSSSPQDIWRWTFTKQATAPCFIRDVLYMKQSNVQDVDFYWLGYIPCRTVLIFGIVVGIQDYEKRSLYTIDDSTAVIDCVLRHPSPQKASTTDASRSLLKPKWDPKSHNTLNGSSSTSSKRIIPPPPPTPVTAIGYPVQVIGKVIRFHNTRQIVAESIAERGPVPAPHECNALGLTCGNELEEPCQSTNDEWKHWKNVVELHKSSYSVPKPFEIPVPLDNVLSTGLEELGTSQDGRLPGPTVNPVSSYHRQSFALTSKTNITAPHTPLKRPLHAPSSPLTDSTTSVSSSPIKSGFAVPPKLRHPSRLHSRDLTENTFRLYLKHYMDHAPTASSSRASDLDVDDDPFTTPTKRPCVRSDQTPKARTTYTAHDQTPRASAPTDIASGNAGFTSGFTLSHLRRIPELALLASRVVHAETNRRLRAEREVEKAKAAQAASTSVSHAANAHSQKKTKTSEAARSRMKRLFSWAVLKLYEEGSIVLWDGPMCPLPVPVPLSSRSGDTSGLWKTANSASSFSFANGSLFSTTNSTMFSSSSVSSSKFIVSEDDAYLSDPPPHEEEEVYVSVTPTLLAGPVREAMRGKGVRSMKAKVGAEGITGYLKRRDERWARIGVWAVEEAMEIVLAEQK